MKVRCASCDTEIERFEVRCPVCLRERTRAEMFGHAKPAAAKAAGGSFRAFLLMLTGTAAVALGVQLHLQKRQEEATSRERAAAAVSVETQAEEKREESAPIPEPQREEPKPVPEPEAEIFTEGRAQAPVWNVSGTVFDLLTLKPAAGARLLFTDLARGKKHAVSADRQGRYRAALPKLLGGGYDLEVRHTAYDGVYVEDSQPSFRAQSKEEREEAYGSFKRTNILHVPLLPPEEQDDVVHDLALLPPG